MKERFRDDAAGAIIDPCILSLHLCLYSSCFKDKTFGR